MIEMCFPRSLYFILLCSFFSVVSYVAAQDQGNCGQRAVTVNVLGNDGIQVTGLSKNDFKVKYRGRWLDITNLTYEDRPRRVVILLDMSGSMNGNDSGKWQVAKAAVSEFAASLSRGSQAGLIAFAENPKVEVTLSGDLSQITEWLNRDFPGTTSQLKGRTALYDAILAGRKVLGPAREGDAIYVVTDGDENASEARLAEVESALSSSGIRLFAFLLARNERDNSELLAAGEPLVGTTSDTGGDLINFGVPEKAGDFSPIRARYVYDKRAKQQIAGYAQYMNQQISGFYSLAFQIPENPTKPQHLEIEVMNGGHRRKDVTMMYPRKMYPCGEKSAKQ